MKNIVFEIVVGVAFLIGILAMMPLFKSNRQYIVNSQSRSDDLELIEDRRDEETDFEANVYLGSDIIALLKFHQETDGSMQNGYKFVVKLNGVTQTITNGTGIDNMCNILSQPGKINKMFKQSKTVEEIEGGTLVTYKYEEQ